MAGWRAVNVAGPMVVNVVFMYIKYNGATLTAPCILSRYTEDRTSTQSIREESDKATWPRFFHSIIMSFWIWQDVFVYTMMLRCWWWATSCATHTHSNTPTETYIYIYIYVHVDHLSRWQDKGLKAVISLM